MSLLSNLKEPWVDKVRIIVLELLWFVMSFDLNEYWFAVM